MHEKFTTFVHLILNEVNYPYFSNQDHQELYEQKKNFSDFLIKLSQKNKLSFIPKLEE